MITDLLKRQSLGKKPRRAGMAQGMPTTVGRLDSKCNKSAIGDIEDTSRLQWPTWRMHAEEYFRAVARRTHRVDVAGQGLSDRRDQWEDLRLAALQAKQPKSMPRPINLIEAQCRHFTAAHPVNRKQQQDGTITDVPGLFMSTSSNMRCTSGQSGAYGRDSC